MHVYLRNVYVYILNIFIIYVNIYMQIHVKKKKSEIYAVCVFLHVHNKYTQYTHVYVNKNFYFGRD